MGKTVSVLNERGGIWCLLNNINDLRSAVDVVECSHNVDSSLLVCWIHNHRAQRFDPGLLLLKRIEEHRNENKESGKSPQTPQYGLE